MATTLTANLILQKTKLDNLRHVRKLNVCGAQVSHIHVLRDAVNAQVLSLSVNSIEDLSPLSGLRDLRELYLRKNNINDLMQVLHLSGLDNLEVLGLSENPICMDGAYRAFTIAAIPSLIRLDDQDITQTERRTAESEFREVLQWAPPEPIPQSQITGTTNSAKASPNRGTLASTVSEVIAVPQTARRPHQNSRASEDDAFPPSRVPATARGLPSSNRASISGYDLAPSGSDSISRGPPPSHAVNSGWDDVPVGGGGPKRPKMAQRSPSPPLRQQHSLSDDHEMLSPSHPSRRLANPQVHNYHQDPMQLSTSQSIPHLRTEAIHSYNGDLNTSSHRPRSSSLVGNNGRLGAGQAFSEHTSTSSRGGAGGTVDEAVVIAAVKLLLDKLSARGLAEIYRYSAPAR